MAARAPTSFSLSLDDHGFSPGEIIKTTDVSLITTDQQYVRDKESVLASSCYHAFSTTSGTATVLTTFFISFDHAGASDSTGAKVTGAIYAWNSSASNFTVGLRYINVYGGGDKDHTVTVSSNQTLQLWRVLAEDASNGLIEADGTEQEVRLIASTTSGTLYVAGHFMNTVEL